MSMIDTVDHIIREHEKIQSDLKLVGDSLSDREALAALKEAKSDVLLNLSEPLVIKVQNTIERLTALREGLRHHYDFEHEKLPPIVGEVLMQGLEMEHDGMLADIEAALSMLTRTRVNGITPDQRITEESMIDALLERMGREKQDHMVKEEAMLGLARLALEAREKHGVTT